MSSATTWKINTDIDPRFFEQIGHTRLDFPAAVCELVDNAISATQPAPDGKCRFNVLVKVTRAKADPSLLSLVVADDGAGVSRTDLVNSVFSLGASSNKAGLCFPALREHGFGLKHALAWFVKDRPSRDFAIVTAHQPTAGAAVEFYGYSGPLQKDMDLRRSSKKEWATLATPMLRAKGNPATGTRIAVVTSFEAARRGWESRRSQTDPGEIPDVHALRLFLGEELGVRYRGFIDAAAGRSIRITFADETLGDSLLRPKTDPVARRPIPYLASEPAFNGKRVGKLVISYERGISNPDRVSPPAAKHPGGFRLYYGHSMRGQGIDVTLNGRVIESGMYPWPDPQHNSNNGLVGELRIEGDAATILTKDGLDWSSSHVLRQVRDELIRADLRGPQGGRKVLTDRFRALTLHISKPARAGAGPALTAFLQSDRTVSSPAHIWPATTGKSLLRPGPYRVPLNEAIRTGILRDGVQRALGVTVNSRDTWGVGNVPVLPADFVFDYGGRTFIVECKDRDANHEDVYQVRRYWDGIAARGGDVRAGIIVADDARPEVKALAEYIEAKGFKDERGNLIRIRFLRWGQFKIPSSMLSGKPVPGPEVKKTQIVLAKLLAKL